jgi:hypothetical protein
MNNFEEKLTQKQVITGDMIKAAGIQTLSDILYLADKWNFCSIDGYEKDVSANNLSSFQRQNFIIMLDGQLIEDKMFDVQNINQIPISIDQVDFVILINTPQIYNGEFTENGLIDIHTKNPSKGLSAQGYYGVGEQAGKAGPYAFTQYATTHVDKLGYYLSENTNYSANDWYLKTAAKIEQNFATDPEISARISNLNLDYNKARMYSDYYKFNLDILGGNQQIMGGTTRQDDFFFFKPYGDEIPVSRFFEHIGLNGSIKTFNNSSLKYSITYSLNNLGQLDNKQNINFDWQMETYNAILEGNYSNEFSNSIIGFGYKKYIGQSPSTLFNKAIELKKTYGQVDFFLTKQFIQSINLYIENSTGKTALKSAIRNNWDISPNSAIRSSYTFSERLFEEDANYWYWQQQGYNFTAPGLFPPVVIGNFSTSKLYTFDLDYDLQVNPALMIDLGANYRHFSNYYIEEQPFQYNIDQSTFYAPDEIFTNVNLKVIGIQAGLEYKILPVLSQKIFYNFQKDIWGSQQFIDAWNEMPEHRISYTIDYEPVKDFGIWAKLRYSSATMWVDYKYTGIQSQGKYVSRVMPMLICDISMQKWLWDKRIWVNILLRNIFDQSEKYIPIGVSNPLRFYISVQFFLNSIIK